MTSLISSALRYSGSASCSFPCLYSNAAMLLTAGGGRAGQEREWDVRGERKVGRDQDMRDVRGEEDVRGSRTNRRGVQAGEGRWEGEPMGGDGRR